MLGEDRIGGCEPTPVGAPAVTVGLKLGHIERLEWHILPDPSTIAAALQAGEID